MKKCIGVVCLLLITCFAKADQLALISHEQAEKAVAYLKKETSVVLWCSCCEGDEMKRITVGEVFVKSVDNGKYYEVILKGRDENGKEVEEALDLAYVFVKKGSKGQSLGKVLKFKCDPCVDPFNWETPGAG
ncbi:hypothetical protein SAMN05421788_107309 [Filimonas lacunae]|uniref:Uncharacterized protein n=1 Tax=Filimonas lacunae TaxID=477680 RepID=A0A173MGM5_9BACT|nr:hypothetical protein [Filimonas lacunae]BAV06649.1 hypothetical protein FLA_2668 [Filimonas lacunae]SIT27752.1 hypothetical protein SAMN05421788_107309 [Filimonas lacunae]